MEIHISKIDAARRQLETAITLFFREGDPVSIHSLTRDSHRILEDICKKQGINSVLEEGFTKLIKPERKQEVLKKVNEARNFFKHADTDPGGVLKFNPDVSEYFLFDACRLYKLLTQEFTKDTFIFQVWFALKHPDVYPTQGDYFRSITSALGSSYDPTNKQANYTNMSQAYDTSKMQGLLP